MRNVLCSACLDILSSITYFFIFSEIRSYFSEAHFYVFISVPPPPDPDKPVISALGFLGKLPGGKCLLRELAKKHQLLAHQEALLVNVC